MVDDSGSMPAGSPLASSIPVRVLRLHDRGVRQVIARSATIPITTSASTINTTRRRRCPRAAGVSKRSLRRPPSDEPDRRGDAQRREREQAATLDPLERPEATDWLVLRPLDVPVLHEALRRGHRPRTADAAPSACSESGRAEQGEHFELDPAPEHILPALGPPLAQDPCRVRDVQVPRDERRQVVLTNTFAVSRASAV